MFTSGEFERINIEYKKKQNERRKKLKMIWGILLSITISLILLFIFLFPNQFQNEDTVWILPSYGGMALAVTLIGYLITIKYISEKPFFEYLYPEIYQQLNMNEGLYLQYQSYEKKNKELNVSGGLFTRGASVVSRRHVKGVADNQIRFDVYDTTMTTSSGNSQQIHFDGTYIVIHQDVHTKVQVRSNGSPKLKGIKFDRKEEIEEMRVFKEKETDLNNLDFSYIRFMKDLNEKPQYKRVYLSIVQDEVHIALWHKKHPARKQKAVTLETINNIYNVFYNEYKFIHEVIAIDSY